MAPSKPSYLSIIPATTTIQVEILKGLSIASWARAVEWHRVDSEVIIRGKNEVIRT